MEKRGTDKTQTETEHSPETKNNTEIIAFRKRCDPRGTGLSHYVLMDTGEDR